MNETKEVQGNAQKQSGTNINDGNNSTSSSLIEQADAAAERLAKENDRREALLAREEEIEARRRLGGEASGPQQPIKPHEETPQEYAKRLISGELNERAASTPE